MIIGQKSSSVLIIYGKYHFISFLFCEIKWLNQTTVFRELGAGQGGGGRGGAGRGGAGRGHKCYLFF